MDTPRFKAEIKHVCLSHMNYMWKDMEKIQMSSLPKDEREKKIEELAKQFAETVRFCAKLVKD